MSSEQTIRLITETRAGNKIKVPATIKYEGGRIWFVKSPFALKDEIKAMSGSLNSWVRAVKLAWHSQFSMSRDVRHIYNIIYTKL